MNKLSIISILYAAVSLTGAGCSKSADVAAIADRVTVLEGKVSTLELDVAAAKTAAMDAASKAAAAEIAANRAAQFAQETNDKVSKIIKQSCAGDC